MNVGALLPGLIRELGHAMPPHLFQYFPAIQPFLELASGRVSSYGLAEGRGPILTKNQTRAIEAHKLTMAPRRKKAKYTNSRAITAAQKGYVRTAGYYGRYNHPMGHRFTNWAGEDKFFDTDISGALGLIDSQWFKVNLAIIPQGVNQSNRIGRKIKISSVHIIGTLFKASTLLANDTGEAIRLEIVQDKQTNGAAYAENTRKVLNIMDSFNNLSNSGRFQTMKQKNINMQQQGAGLDAWPTMVRQVNMYKKCNVIMEYDASLSTGAVSTQRTNSIWFTQVSYIGQTVNFQNARARIRFRDV